MIRIKHKGNFNNTEKFLRQAKSKSYMSILSKYGAKGVRLLASATPVDTGLTASSWYYEIENTQSGTTITWNNSNIQNGVSIALILQYGHTTRTGGWVEGKDYINPAIQPLFDALAEEAWEEVTKV